MAISVTIEDGQVMVCICATTTSSNVDEVCGPFADKGAALDHLCKCNVNNMENYAEAERLCELGVPFFIAVANVDESADVALALDAGTDEIGAAVLANVAVQASEKMASDVAFARE